MELKPLFYMIFKSLNPESHRELQEHTFGQAFKYFLFILLLSIFFMFILFIPKFIALPSVVDNNTAYFDSMNINFSFSLKEPFNLLEDPAIRVDKKGANLTNERVLITEDSIFYRKFLFFGQKTSMPLDEGLDVKDGANIKSLLSTLFWFVLPSVMFWSIIFFFIYFIGIILITCAVFLLFAWAFQLKLGWTRITKSAIYAATIMIILQLILMPYYRLILFPIIAYWILLLIVILVLKDEMQPHGRANLFVDGGHHKNVFAKSPKQDSYDIDMHGNLKGNKKKHSYDEENEGYVELK